MMKKMIENAVSAGKLSLILRILFLSAVNAQDLWDAFI